MIFNFAILQPEFRPAYLLAARLQNLTRLVESPLSIARMHWEHELFRFGIHLSDLKHQTSNAEGTANAEHAKACTPNIERPTSNARFMESSLFLFDPLTAHDQKCASAWKSRVAFFGSWKSS